MNKQLRYKNCNVLEEFVYFNPVYPTILRKYCETSKKQLNHDVQIESKPQDIRVYKFFWKLQLQYGIIRATRNQSCDTKQDKKECITGITWIYNLVHRTINGSLQVPPHRCLKDIHITNQQHGEVLPKNY